MANNEINRDCMEYKGVCYDVGTRVKMTPRMMSDKYVGTVTSCDGGSVVIVFDEGFSNVVGKLSIHKHNIEIIQPIYYKPSIDKASSKSQRDRPPDWDVEVAWIWYIVLMVVLTLFKARILGWIGTTAIFFLWKNGFLNGGKK